MTTAEIDQIVADKMLLAALPQAERDALDAKIARIEEARAEARAKIDAQIAARRAVDAAAQAAESRETSFALACEDLVKREPQLAHAFGSIGNFIAFAKRVLAVVELIESWRSARSTSPTEST